MIEANSTDAEVALLSGGFWLCLKGGFSGAEIEYSVVSDFCSKHMLDKVGVYAAFKEVVSKVFGS